MTEGDPKHRCDACGEKIVGEHFTDEEVCGATDGPGFFLCGDAECIESRPQSLRHRRRRYTHQRAANEKMHEHTAESTMSFHVEMGRDSADESFSLGELLGMSTAQIEALTNEELEKLLRCAFDDWSSTHVSGGWSFDRE